MSSVGENIFQLAIIFIIFLVVLALTYYTTKWIAGYQKSHTYNQNLRIVETIKITQNKYLQIVEAGKDNYFVIAIGKDEITMLGTLTKDQLREEKNDFQLSTGGTGFDQLLNSFKDKISKNGE
ncbi:MAG: flagellar biosynthetic protein FliO [Lachnospiraceae bacterium]|nr:flagellar biosynthetic protein FliO [Lachnospiraceae bacterium]